jgi:hypothetical protein
MSPLDVLLKNMKINPIDKVIKNEKVEKIIERKREKFKENEEII